jgi:hypothetical protein
LMDFRWETQVQHLAVMMGKYLAVMMGKC